jgi:hypothetical protein
MRSPTIILGVISSTLILAGCSGDQATTEPNVAPSFSKISTSTQYTFAFTCNDAARFSQATVYLDNGGSNIASNVLLCGSTWTQEGFDSFRYLLITRSGVSDVLKVCDHTTGLAARTGTFVCNQGGFVAKLRVEQA